MNTSFQTMHLGRMEGKIDDCDIFNLLRKLRRWDVVEELSLSLSRYIKNNHCFVELPVALLNFFAYCLVIFKPEIVVCGVKKRDISVLLKKNLGDNYKETLHLLSSMTEK